ncbi:hypothetical protein [Azospirillum brasilense]|uniref:hypothetical protein n=1 Tax=Azospirillum brasilense TaxID=192 RepID=UPI00157BB1CF|nr:hypothetical protein [Azospirillum brasilense]
MAAFNRVRRLAAEQAAAEEAESVRLAAEQSVIEETAADDQTQADEKPLRKARK